MVSLRPQFGKHALILAPLCSSFLTRFCGRSNKTYQDSSVELLIFFVSEIAAPCLSFPVMFLDALTFRKWGEISSAAYKRFTDDKWELRFWCSGWHRDFLESNCSRGMNPTSAFFIPVRPGFTLISWLFSVIIGCSFFQGRSAPWKHTLEGGFCFKIPRWQLGDLVSVSQLWFMIFFTLSIELGLITWNTGIRALPSFSQWTNMHYFHIFWLFITKARIYGLAMNYSWGNASPLPSSSRFVGWLLMPACLNIPPPKGAAFSVPGLLHCGVLPLVGS